MDETKKDPIYLPPGGFNFQHCFYREYLMQFSNRLDALEALTPKRSSSGCTGYVSCTQSPTVDKDIHLHNLATKINFLAHQWATGTISSAEFVDNVRCAIYPNGLDEPK